MVPFFRFAIANPYVTSVRIKTAPPPAFKAARDRLSFMCEAGKRPMKFFSYWRSLAALRVRIALNLKGVQPDEVIDIDLVQGSQRDDAFRKINPMMALPALIEDDGNVLFESLAILEYLDETHPNPPLLPKAPKDRARVRALAQICAADTHPLIVPRVREYLGREFKADPAGINKWGHHWHQVSLTALEAELSRSKQTGTYAHGEQITLADICLCGNAVGAAYFKCDIAPYPTFKRIVDACWKIDAFARAHPLKQPGAPASL
jgi:maleylacetoacetate isomerase/maleylpyruvate isomerase